MSAEQSQEAFFRKCTSCKAEIAWNTKYWVCNVSTCNRKRTGLVFCSVSCWDAHLPIVRHREAWSEERKSPKSLAALIEDERMAEEDRERASRVEKGRLAEEERKRQQEADQRSKVAPKVLVRRRNDPSGE